MAMVRFDWLREAYEIIDGIPPERFNLSTVCTGPKAPDPTHCGTIGCAAGWIAMHPKFIERGLSIDRDSTFTWMGETESDYSVAMYRVFNLPLPGDARNLFSTARSSKYDNLKAAKRCRNSKELWQFRVRMFLKEHGELKG